MPSAGSIADHSIGDIGADSGAPVAPGTEPIAWAIVPGPEGVFLGCVSGGETKNVFEPCRVEGDGSGALLKMVIG